MAENFSLARASCQPHHSSRYTVGPHQTSKRAPKPDRQGIQFESLALDGVNILGKCACRDWSCAISSEAVGRFCRRFPRGHGGVQPPLGVIHNN